MEEFKPNNLKPEDIDSLSDWQLLVSACHFGPAMGDCIELDYGYTFEHGTIYCGTVSLDGDIDAQRPVEALKQYAGYPDPYWKDFAKSLLKEKLVE